MLLSIGRQNSQLLETHKINLKQNQSSRRIPSRGSCQQRKPRLDSITSIRRLTSHPGSLASNVSESNRSAMTLRKITRFSWYLPLLPRFKTKQSLRRTSTAPRLGVPNGSQRNQSIKCQRSGHNRAIHHHSRPQCSLKHCFPGEKRSLETEEMYTRQGSWMRKTTGSHHRYLGLSRNEETLSGSSDSDSYRRSLILSERAVDLQPSFGRRYIPSHRIHS